MTTLLATGSLESATRYPSIPFYHLMDDRGRYTDAVNTPLGDRPYELVAREKMDGTTARIIIHPDGDWQIGSRIEILATKGDLVYRTTEGIADLLLDYVDHVAAAIGSPGLKAKDRQPPVPKSV